MDPALGTNKESYMGELYQKMARDLKLKNLAATTQNEYLRCCYGFARYHMKSPAELGETGIKEYLAHLQLRGAGPETLKMNVAGLKFLYGVTLDRPKVAARLPWPKVSHNKPDILSGTELEKVLSSVTTLVPAMGRCNCRSAQGAQRGGAHGEAQEAYHRALDAPRLRDASVGNGHRHPGHPGVAWPRLHSNDGALHAGERETCGLGPKPVGPVGHEAR